jgi:hypothetical protein
LIGRCRGRLSSCTSRARSSTASRFVKMPLIRVAARVDPSWRSPASPARR